MFLYSHWLALDLPTRNRLAVIFGIQKKGTIHVVDNYVQNDGYLIKDVEQALNIDAIQAYLNTKETDMETLWQMLIAPPPIVPVTGTPPIPFSTPTGTTVKHAKKRKQK